MSKDDQIKAMLREVQEKSEKTCDNTSVGIIIYKEGKLLLLERKKPPFGFAPPAGHVDEHGSFKQAAINEVREEVGLIVKSLKLISKGKRENYCRRKGGTWHYWKLYKANVEGELTRSEDETKQAGWYTKDEVANLAERTEKYLAGEISEEDWQNNPGLETTWMLWSKEEKIL
jgi:ADP-ribose pyrophosphatase YjhB (NUDIX family)